jgi:hypothetical protein
MDSIDEEDSHLDLSKEPLYEESTGLLVNVNKNTISNIKPELRPRGKISFEAEGTNLTLKSKVV